jgi:hypothetical protein
MRISNFAFYTIKRACRLRKETTLSFLDNSSDVIERTQKRCLIRFYTAKQGEIWWA